ncbi:ethanolamine kinase 1-like [Haliotis rubra]|uniref:ethanolamine kinase 1-like n=1 Tax=Haliotis rubra TaxID=36100 RepID=UPI001EE61FED|nr:ethanolamine kinase 1-like [Haliotis rubra]
MAASIPHYEISVDTTKIQDGAREIIKRVKPAWDIHSLTFKLFTEGITNALVGGYQPDNKDDMVLVRIYGEKTELIIDRQAEKDTFILLSGAGCSPPLYCTFTNGMAYGFVKGVPLDEKMVKDANIRTLIAKEIAKLHSLKKSDQGTSNPVPYIFTKIQNFINLAPDSFPEQERQKIFEGELQSKAAIQEEFNMLKGHLEALTCDVVFSHNDLLLQNIVFDSQSNKVGFIDYEYGFYNLQAFDIGNHFNEYAGVDEVDYSRFPDRDYQLSWIRIYLEEYYSLIGRQSTVSDTDVERLYVQVNKCALGSHFFWGVWALIQAQNSKIDFDFLAYSVTRFKEYFRRRDAFLSLKEPLI